MSMPTDPEFRNKRIAKALDSVRAASRARGWYHQFEEGHRLKTPDNEEMTRSFLENTIRTAMGYGFPVEAVAVAADMSTDEVLEIAEDDAAA